MSLKTNIVANTASQLYVTLIGIAMVPLYLRRMGAEAYGLVGFFTMLQAWFSLLDLGLSPTVARQTACFYGGAMDALSYRRLLRVLEVIFLTIAVAGGGVLFLASETVASRWLTARQLPIHEVTASIQLMAVGVALRWMSGLYRGQISGSERLVFLSVFNSVIATLRFVGIVPVFVMIGTAPSVFFSYQLLVAVVELAGLCLFAYSLLPAVPEGDRVLWSWAPLKPVLKFSLSIAFSGSVWVLVTQTDKLILSKVLPLAEYGCYTLAVLVASGITLISGPVSGAIMPRMVRLEAEGDHAGLIRVYRQSTQLVAVIAGSATVTVSLYAESLLWAWTGDRALAQHAAPILTLYALGNGILAVSAFPYYLQYAKGNLKLHLIGNAGFVLFLVPAIVWASSRYGAVGAGYTWLATNALYFVAWIPLVHHKFEPRLNRPWYGRDVLAVVITIACFGFALFTVTPVIGNHWRALLVISGFGLLTMLSGACASSAIWGRLNERLSRSLN